MIKRMRAIALILIVSLLSLGGRIFYIAYYNADTASVSGSAHAEYYGSRRGLIFDRNLQQLVETQKVKKYSQINPAFSFEVPERYAVDQLCPHLIGYTDAENNGVSGIEKDYNSFLKAIPNRLLIKTYKDARGNTLKGKGTVIDTSESCTNSGIALTIDKNIQSVVQTAGKRLGSGAIVVMRSDSGEIEAMASFPTYNPKDIASALKNGDKPLINRALCLYNVGSVFKSIVCLAALESGVSPAFSYSCNGKTVCGGTVFHCHKEDGHGSVDMKKALAFSCNTYFIALAQYIGYEKILEMCRRFELDEAITLSQSIMAAAGNLPKKEDLASPAAVANLSFGQGQLLASPLSLCRIYAAIHNGGSLVTPQLVFGEVKNGNISAQSSSQSKPIIRKQYADSVMEFLTCAVSHGTGRSAAVKNCAVAGKTATAQTGKYTGSKEKLISYFIGLISVKGDKYTILVMRENGTSGSADCAPIFKEICEKIQAQKKE
ncbi:MAG: penicillin-binding protein 2 [Clostridia bacterium]|nr:penicillin-binding protein 2 [Clostridia bacterium]